METGQGALDSLLGSITAALVSEAQLLGGIRGNVEFIKYEIECMNSLILYLTEAPHRNRQVRTWMRQVVGLARDCDGNVELYIHYVRGGPGDNIIRRTLRFLRTIHVRRRIAARIQELKVHAHEVGERRLRYGITVPTSSEDNGAEAHDDDDGAQSPRSPAVKEEDCLRRRAYILEYALWEDEKVVNRPTTLGILWDAASMLIGNYKRAEKVSIGQVFNAVFSLDEFAAKMFLHLIYINPQMRIDDMKKYRDTTIPEWKEQNLNIAREVVMSCYRVLPTKYKTCLLYLAIFPKGHTIRATSLARRWFAEGLISSTAGDDTTSATDKLERYLDVLATRGFVRPEEISAAGDVKSFTVYDEVYQVVARIARDVSFVDTNLHPDLVGHLSIHNRISLLPSHSEGQSRNIVDFLPALAASPQWQYLSLRKTDVTELPKQIKELQCLETLDIRQTQVPVLARKAIVLPRLKHFLAGHKVPAADGGNRFEESFSTVHIPASIQKMENMELLSNVQVSDCDRELAGIARLLKLRKLGVTLRGERANLNDLFHHVMELRRILRSLSIRIDQPTDGENHNAGMTVNAPLEFIKSININGLTHGFSHLIGLLPQLVKVTLSSTNLNTNDLSIIGNLLGLRCLRLRHRSCTESDLAFEEGKFKSLNFLLVEGNNITNISFVTGAAPKLERIIWSFATMEALSGITHLHELRWLELNGDCDLRPVTTQINSHQKRPALKHNGHNLCQEDRIPEVASTSSAPST
ncbi:hypothetical protein EJB05_26179, partial [Eragrostis curvula]